MFIDTNGKADLIKNQGITDKNKHLPISGIFKIKSYSTSFNMLSINSDDSSIVDRYWNDDFVDRSLDKWIEWTQIPGTYIDVGAHTGLFTLAALANNNENFLISFEPYALNFYRMISNIRLNQFPPSRFSLFNKPVSDQNKNIKFEVESPFSYLSKGGKIGNEGIEMQTVKLDDLQFNNQKQLIKGIKIDTEGEDLNVLIGASNLLKLHHPKMIVETRPSNIKDIVNFILSCGYEKIYDKKKLNFKDDAFYIFSNNKISKDIFIE